MPQLTEPLHWNHSLSITGKPKHWKCRTVFNEFRLLKQRNPAALYTIIPLPIMKNISFYCYRGIQIKYCKIIIAETHRWGGIKYSQQINFFETMSNNSEIWTSVITCSECFESTPKLGENLTYILANWSHISLTGSFWSL